MPQARTTDPQTSHEAARSVDNVTATQIAIIGLLTGGLTDTDLVDLYRRNMRHGLVPLASESGIRTRRAELVARGLVQDTGERIRLASGRSAIVWKTV